MRGAIAPLAGAAALLVVVANANHLGIAIDRVAWAAVIIGCLASALCLHRGGWRELALICGVLLLPAFYYLAPAILRGTRLFVVDAGDLPSYLSAASWLTHRPIIEAPDLGKNYSPGELFVVIHQLGYLRLGALFGLALAAVISERTVLEVFTFYSAGVLSLLSVAVYVFAQAAFPALDRRFCAAIAVLYSVSPIATWMAYAGFLPQVLGFAFLLSGVAVFMTWIRLVLDTPGKALDHRTTAEYALLLALMLFGAWCSYPEAVPVGLAFCFIYSGILAARSRALTRPVLTQFIFVTSIAIALAIALSPSTFLWGVKGMIVQLSGIPHGGEQLTGLRHLFGTMVLASQAPLVPGIIASMPLGFSLLGYTMCALGAVGLAGALRETPTVTLTVFVIGVLLFASVAFKYRFSAYGWYAAWPALFTWNIYKATQYLAAFVGVLALGGLILGTLRLRPAALRVAALLLVVLVPLGVTVGQATQVWQRASTDVGRDLAVLVQRVPSGRVLIDIDPARHAFWQGLALYSLVVGRPVITTRDLVPPAMTPRSEAYRASFLSVPLSYVITDIENRFSDLPVLDTYGRFRLLDARAAEVDFTILSDTRLRSSPGKGLSIVASPGTSR
jgi:hypothetical protein